MTKRGKDETEIKDEEKGRNFMADFFWKIDFDERGQKLTESGSEK